jgi:ABC-type multidrug transport system permease subunit
MLPHFALIIFICPVQFHCVAMATTHAVFSCIINAGEYAFGFLVTYKWFKQFQLSFVTFCILCLLLSIIVILSYAVYAIYCVIIIVIVMY